MKYWAFLSYSHTDKKWGDWLHKALETYRVPRRLVGKDSRDGKIPERLFPIFRDREELPVSADLGSNINEALKESRYLIVICSPRSAQSRWVGEEIKTFKNLGREDRILALIVGGEPNASDGKSGFKVEDECFHEAMRYRMVDGELSEVRSEPIAADAREGKDGKTNAKLKLLAGLLAVNYDDLKQREQERRLRRARIIVATSVMLIAVFAALSVALFFNARAARRARDEAKANLSRSDFVEAQRLIDAGKTNEGLAYLARAVRTDPNNAAAATRIGFLLTDRRWPWLVWRSKAQPLTTKPLFAEVPAAEWSNDSSRIVSADEWGTVHVWEAQTGRMIAEIVAHDPSEKEERAGVSRVCFSPDGTRVATAAKDGAARVWDAATGKPLTPVMKHDQEVADIDWSPDGTRLVTASKDSAQIWDASTGAPLTQFGNFKLHDNLHRVRFSPDGKKLLTAGAKFARLWNVETGEPVGNEISHRADIFRVAFSYDGTRFLTASTEGHSAIYAMGVVSRGQMGSGTVIVSDSETAEPVIDPINYSSTLEDVEFSRSGDRIVAACEKAPVTIKSIANPGSPTISLPQTGAWSAAFNFGGNWILTTSSDRRARIWDATTMSLAFECADRSWPTTFARFSNDGSRVLSGLNDGTICVWELGDRRALPTRLPGLRPTSEPPQFLPGKTVIVVPNGTLVDLETGHVTPAPSIPDTEPAAGTRLDLDITLARVSPDGSILACIGTPTRIWPDGSRRIIGTPGALYLMDVRSHTWMGEPIRHEKPIRFADFSPDNSRIITISGDEARISVLHGQGFVGTLKRAHDAQRFGFGSAFWSPDSTIVALETGEGDNALVSVQFSNILSGEVISATKGLDIVATRNPIFAASVLNSLRFSRDGKRILTACGQYADIWDVQTGKRIGEPMEHGYIVHSAEFSPNQESILTASWDQTCRIWDANTHRLISQPLHHDTLVNDATFAPDGRFTATASGVIFNRYGILLEESEKEHVEERYTNRAVSIWDVQTGKLLNDPTPDEHRAAFVEFSTDEHRIVTDAGNGRAIDFPIFQSEDSRKDLDLLALFAETVGGVRLTPAGLLDNSPCTTALPNCDEIQRRLRTRSESGSEVRLFVDWFLADHSTRAISPYSKISVPDYIENRIKENTAESLDEAEELSIGNPQLLQRIKKLREALSSNSSH